MNVAVPPALPSAVPSALPAQGTITEHPWRRSLPAGTRWCGTGRSPASASGSTLRRQGLRGADAGAPRHEAHHRGRHGVIGAVEARRRAALIIARIRAGDEPVPEAQKTETITVATLAARYLHEHVAVRCKPTTAAQYRLAIERYIVPALGTRPVSSLGRARWPICSTLSATGRPWPNLVIATLSRMVDQGIAWGVAGEMSNPCRSAPKYRTRRRERFLTDAEFQALGRVLDEMEAEGRISPHAAAALRLLMLTGCRRNEILTLRWEDVRLQTQELSLRDSKTGPRTLSLSPEAAQVLATLPRLPGTPG